MKAIVRLHEAVAAICPIDGLSANRIDFRPEATAEQRAAAERVLAEFDWDAPDPEAAQIEADRLAVDEYLAKVESGKIPNNPLAVALRAMRNTVWCELTRNNLT